MERTADIKSDANAGNERKLENSGKKIIGEFLETADTHALKKSLGAFDKKERHAVIKGAASLLLTRLKLPQSELESESLSLNFTALEVLCPNSGIKDIGEMLQTIFARFLDDTRQTEQALVQQYMPTLRQKEAELARRTGQRMQLSPEDDPEFMQLLNKTMERVRTHYQGAIDQARENICRILGIDGE